MKKVAIILSVVLLAAVFAIWASISSNSTDQLPQGKVENQEESNDQPPFELNLTSLNPLGESMAYELWILRSNQAISLGRFDVVSNEGDLEGDFEELSQNLIVGDEIIITIEANDDADGQPSGIVVLSGAVGENVSERVILSFALDLGQVSGDYILGTQTNDPEGFETSGIRFVKPSGQQPSLNLPDAPVGWRYEGWVFHGGHYFSSGRFGSISGLDDFDDYSDVHPGPNFPGEDYLNDLPYGFERPLDLVDDESEIIVSLELDREAGASVDAQQESPQPYVILLHADISQDASAHKLYPLIFEESGLPTGYLMVN